MAVRGEGATPNKLSFIYSKFSNLNQLVNPHRIFRHVCFKEALFRPSSPFHMHSACGTPLYSFSLTIFVSCYSRLDLFLGTFCANRFYLYISKCSCHFNGGYQIIFVFENFIFSTEKIRLGVVTVLGWFSPVVSCDTAKKTIIFPHFLR